jgi:hypothetical protein
VIKIDVDKIRELAEALRIKDFQHYDFKEVKWCGGNLET